MKRSICKAAAIVSAILLLPYLALLLVFNSGRFQQWLLEEIAGRTGYAITAGEIALDPLLRLSLRDVTSSSPDRFELRAQKIVIVPGVETLFWRGIQRLEINRPALRLNLRGFFAAEGQESMAMSIRRLSVDDGTLVVATGPGSDLSFRSMAIKADNVNLAAGLDLHLRAAVPSLDGVAAVTLRRRGAEESSDFAVAIRLEQNLGGDSAAGSKPHTAAEGTIHVTAADGQALRVEAAGKFDGMRFLSGSYSGTAKASGEIQRDSQKITFTSTVVATELPLRWVSLSNPKESATLRMRGDYDIGRKSLGLASVELTSAIGEAAAAGRLSLIGTPSWQHLRVELRKLPLIALKPMFPAPLRSMAVAGQAESKFTLNGPWNDPILAGNLRVRQGAFSTDATKSAEGLSIEARFGSLRFDSGKNIIADGKIALLAGEVLWERFYADLRPQQPTLEFDGEYRFAEDSLHLRRAAFSLDSIGRVDVMGDIGNVSKKPAIRMTVKSDRIETKGVFALFIREPFHRTYPILDRLTVAGSAALSAEVDGTFDRWAGAGALTLHGGDVRSKTGNWRLNGIEVTLPFRLGYPTPGNSPAADVARGQLTIASLSFGAQTVTALQSVLSLRNNEMRLHDRIRLPVYGGLLELEGVTWENIIANPKAVSLSLAAKDLQLRQLTEALDWYRFGGTLSGSIPKVAWAGESLRSDGQVDIALFGGRVMLTGLEVEAPFSAAPSIKLDARLQNIQLEQASETFSFGSISGVLEGTVSDLIVTAGQPSRFTADLYSVDRSGVSQRISVESLNKITVLSSGESAGALYSGLAGIFDSFRYSKLGFKATLKNDKLTLRGVESRDEQQYLVVGSFIPPTVNIISHTQEIAFLELLRRLERIQKADTPGKAAQ